MGLEKEVQNCVMNDGKEQREIPRKRPKRYYCTIQKAHKDGDCLCEYTGNREVIDIGANSPRLRLVYTCLYDVKCQK